MKIELVVLGISLTWVAATAAPRCEDALFSGIDSRLAPDILGAVPDPKLMIGFEVFDGVPVVASRDQLLVIGPKGISKIGMTAVRGISVDARKNVLVQTDRNIEALGESGLTPENQLTEVIHGHLFDSGAPVLLEVRSKDRVTEFVARRRDGRQSFLIASFAGSVVASSWNKFGLAAIVEDSLYVWNAGSQMVVRLVTDRGLRSAKDVVLVGSDRAIVTLKATVLLVAPETVLIVAAMHLARCRYEDGLLYLVNGQNGLIWALKGLDKLGTKAGDRTHALELLKKASGEDSPPFLEAARIIGCDQARKDFAIRKP
jgi:hypothetical protein